MTLVQSLLCSFETNSQKESKSLCNDESIGTCVCKKKIKSERARQENENNARKKTRGLTTMRENERNNKKFIKIFSKYVCYVRVTPL